MMGKKQQLNQHLNGGATARPDVYAHPDVPENLIPLHQAAEILKTDKTSFASGKGIVKIGKTGPKHVKKRSNKNNEEEDN